MSEMTVGNPTAAVRDTVEPSEGLDDGEVPERVPLMVTLVTDVGTIAE